MSGKRGCNVKHEDKYESLRDMEAARAHEARIASGDGPPGYTFTDEQQLPAGASSTTKGSKYAQRSAGAHLKM